MRKYLLSLSLLVMISPLYSASSTSVDMELYNTMYRGEEDWFFAGSGTVGLTFNAEKNRNVQGQFEMDLFPFDSSYSGSVTTSSSLSYLSIQKAAVKIRFDRFRLTTGKTRLAWGEGVVFNSGDLLFGSLTPFVDLTDEEIRDETAWLTAVNIPLANFRYLEFAILPPAFEITGSEISTGKLYKTKIGGRYFFQWGGTNIETGYLYDDGHKPYFALQGNIGPDWYASSTVTFPNNNFDSEIVKESFSASFGLFQLFNINRDNTLSLRLESLVLPFQNWEEQGDRSGIYGLYLYPEIVFSQGASLAYSLQSVISPIDGSANLSAGASWNVFQGLTLLTYFTTSLGESSDTFAWDRSDLWSDEIDRINGISIMTGVRYKY